MSSSPFSPTLRPARDCRCGGVALIVRVVGSTPSTSPRAWSCSDCGHTEPLGEGFGGETVLPSVEHCALVAGPAVDGSGQLEIGAVYPAGLDLRQPTPLFTPAGVVTEAMTLLLRRLRSEDAPGGEG